MESIFIKNKQTNKQTKNSKKTPIIPLLGSQTKQNVHQLTAVEVKGNVALSLNVEIIRHPYRISSPTNGFVIELVEALERNLGCGSFNYFFSNFSFCKLSRSVHHLSSIIKSNIEDNSRIWLGQLSMISKLKQQSCFYHKNHGLNTYKAIMQLEMAV